MSRVRCPYCGQMYDPDRVEHEPMDDTAERTECVIVPVELPHLQQLRDTF